MDDGQYQVLDECYFLTNFSKLNKALNSDEGKLEEILQKLWQLDYLRVYEKPDGIEYPAGSILEWKKVCFIISKKGLLKHTGF